MTERNMRQRVLQAIPTEFDPISVENPARPGTPDINYREGWIELKQLKDWPAGADTVVQVETFTPQQRVWLRRRARAGGRIHLLLQVGSLFLLLDGAVAADILGRCTQDELLLEAICLWPGSELEMGMRLWLQKQ